MCGIAGAINYQKYDLQKMQQAMFHRGPDNQSIFIDKNVALLHNRLAIIDLSENGNQPLHFQKFTIIFNGEIYNYLELKKHLNEFEFKTNSDTEVLLYMYIKFKNDMFKYLDGAFAFAILDREDNTIFLARDRAGKKPLYYFCDSESFVFASELNTIRAVLDVEIDRANIESYLRVGLFFKPKTAFKNLYAIPNGTYMIVDLESLNIITNSYFDIKKLYQNRVNLNFEDAKLELEIRLKKAIKSRVDSSDLEVGAFLSGGIDSSLVVAMASEFKSNLKTFTVRFDGGYDESNLALLTSKKYGTKHTAIDIDLNLKRDIFKILDSYGEPFFDSSAIPSYYVSQEAKKHLTVILNGDGADELFGGYRRYVGLNYIEIAKKFKFLKTFIPKPKDKKSLYNYIYRLLEISSKSKPLDFYLSLTMDIFEGIDERFSDLDMSYFIESVLESNLSPLSKMLYLDFEIILACNLLIKMDIATMQHSLEGRSPFLSSHILEFAPTLNDSYKINSKTTKYILRELAKKYLPQELITQPKRGFEVPLKNWVDNELKEVIFDTVSNYSLEFFDKKFIEDLKAKKLNIADEKRAKILWTLFGLEVFRKRL